MKNLRYSLFLLPLIFGSCVTEEAVSYHQPDPVNYSFKWKNYEADATNDHEWCMSRSNKWVAFTDYDNKIQFKLNWTGGMGDGDKEDATVSLILDGEEPLVYKIAYLNLEQDGENCSIDFLTADGSEGMVNFPL